MGMLSHITASFKVGYISWLSPDDEIRTEMFLFNVAHDLFLLSMPPPLTYTENDRKIRDGHNR